MKKLTSPVAGLFTAAVLLSTYAVANANPVEKELTVNNVTLQYSDAGAGDVIVGVHGAVSDKRVWDAYQEPLSDNHRFIGYSRRYYGTAPLPEGEHVYDASVHAEDLAAIIRNTGSAPVHLISRSSGGYAAVITAVKYPELVRSLVMWEPFIGNDFVPSADFDEKSVELINSFRKGFGPAVKTAKAGDTKRAVELFIEHVYEMEEGSFGTLPENFQQVLYDNARTLPLLYSGKTTDKVTCDFVGQIKVPTLVLRGGETDDGYALPHIKAAECIPGSTLKVVDGVVHDGPGRKPDEITALALDFWRNLQ